MRLRDFIGSIIFAVLALAAAAVLAVVYVIPTQQTLVNQTISESKVITQTNLNYINSNISKYDDRYITDQTEFTHIGKNLLKENFSDYFDKENKGAILKEGDLYKVQFDTNEDVIHTDTEANYYYYIYNDDLDFIGRLDLNQIFSNYESDVTYYLFTKDGSVISSNNGDAVNNKNIYSILRNNSSDNVDQKLKDTLTYSDNKETYATNLKSGYFCATEFGDYYYAQLITNIGSTLGMDTVTKLTIVYSIGIVIVGIIVFFVLLLGFRKASHVIDLDKSNYKKGKNLIIRTKKNGDVIRVNRTLRAILGKKIKLTNVKQFKVERYEHILECMKREMEFVVSIKDSNDKVCYFDFVTIKDRNDYYLIGYDVSKQYLNNQLLLKMSSKNTTTDIKNLMALAVDLPNIMEKSVLKKVTFVYIDITDFREINKIFGREIGDKVLIAFSNVIKKVFTGFEFYHAEADNFIVVVEDDEEYVAGTYCANLIEALKSPIVVNKNQIFVHAKMGTYNLDMALTPSITVTDIRRMLELAVKKAKKSANKYVVPYDSSFESMIKETQTMQMHLQKAVENNEFIMKFQPQYDIFTNKIVSFEALIRWTNPLYAKSSPQAFIELAESTGYITEIGNFVIRESFKTAKLLEQYNCHVSINVSPAQIMQAGFVSDLVMEFHKNQLQKGSIAIEITETFVMENFDIVLEKLRMLSKEGFSIHLDDFGTGYSSMLYLKDMPCDTIKIDKEFTKDIETQKFNYTMVQDICKMANDLGLNIICEGIETKGQCDILKKFGCHVIQGWLIGKASTLVESIDLIEKYNNKPVAEKAKGKAK